MDCYKADKLIMKYMDKAISEQEAQTLHEHISVCETCKGDFLIYDEMVNVFSAMEWAKAPENFEALVMEQVRKLEPLSKKVTSAVDNIWCAVWGVFSILLGIGTLLALNGDLILTHMQQTPALSGYVPALQGLSADISLLLGEVSLSFTAAANYLSGYMASIRFVLVAVLGVLIAAQFFVYRKDKVRA